MADVRLNVYSVSGFCHFSAAFRTFATCLDAVFHAANLFAAIGAGLAHIGANTANALIKSRIAQHEITGDLADFRTINH